MDTFDSKSDTLENNKLDFVNNEGGTEHIAVGFSASEQQEKFLGSPSNLRGSTTTEKIPITDEQIADVREQFRPLFNKQYSTLGHGTITESAKQILTEGLDAKVPNLSSTTIPLFQSTKDYDEQDPEVFRNLIDWPHYHAESVVVLQIPNPDPDEANYPGMNKWFNSVWEKVGSNPYMNKYKIPKEYIRGYWNASLGKFIPNPDFAPKKPHFDTADSHSITDKVSDPNQPQGGIEIPTISKSIPGDKAEVW